MLGHLQSEDGPLIAYLIYDFRGFKLCSGLGHAKYALARTM